MYKQALTALAIAFGSMLSLSSASCGTCPAGQQSCGTANASPTAGAAGSDSAATCDLLTALHKCMTAFCASASNPFCTCYKRHDDSGNPFDIDTASCNCVEIDEQQFCQNNKGASAESYDCAAESSRLSSVCVPVR